MYACEIVRKETIAIGRLPVLIVMLAINTQLPRLCNRPLVYQFSGQKLIGKSGVNSQGLNGWSSHHKLNDLNRK